MSIRSDAQSFMWVLLALATAFLTSFQDILAKRASLRISPYVISWGWAFFSLPFLLIGLLWEPKLQLGPGFWLALAADTVTFTCGTILLFKAIELSDLSLTVPILSFTPLFLLVTSPLLLGEFPTIFGIIGVVMIVGGSYILFYHPEQEDILSPFRRMLHSRGSQYMLLTAILFSIGANLDKIGVRNSSPLVWSITLNSVCSLTLGGIMFFKVPKPIDHIKREWIILLLIGLAVALLMICQMNAIRMSLVPYVIAIKRISILLTSLWGFFVLKEKGGWQRLVGIVCMLSGVFVISVIG